MQPPTNYAATLLQTTHNCLRRVQTSSTLRFEPEPRLCLRWLRRQWNRDSQPTISPDRFVLATSLTLVDRTRHASGVPIYRARAVALPTGRHWHMIPPPMPGLFELAVSNPLEARMTNRGWHQIDGRWSCSLGERGIRIRLFENRRGGVFYRAVWQAGRGKNRRSLGTTDRKEAERQGKALLATLRQGEASAIAQQRLTLGELWERYSKTCPAYLGHTRGARVDAATRAGILVAYFGEHCDVRSLDADDVAAYAKARQAGGIVVNDTWKTAPVRPRSAVADLTVLHRMLNWARTTRVHGTRLLDANPLAGCRRVSDPNPRRPVTTWDRFTATRRAMQDAAAGAREASDRRVWAKAELALVLAEATGRRLGAIRQLRWEDIDWEHGTMRWRAAADKKRKQWVVPVGERLITVIRQFQRQLGAVGGWLFATEHDPTEPMDRHVFARLLKKAEDAAGLPKLEGSLWHAYRRKWATERKHLPLVDVAAAGGWTGTATLSTCYQQPTNDVLLAVMTEERKVRDVAVLGGP